MDGPDHRYWGLVSPQVFLFSWENDEMLEVVSDILAFVQHANCQYQENGLTCENRIDLSGFVMENFELASCRSFQSCYLLNYTLA